MSFDEIVDVTAGLIASFFQILLRTVLRADEER